ncbi:MAG: hypothetical protein SPJ69_02100 [Campylobacter sp.]|uniref:hypothetical protein n=1 Tax=Campylobacter sp. TaxID=205 RepID=UPI0029713E12|nr:hypothetical protein [Campylobacter sp.]MDD7599448.1 hypothetical protein [Campylobacteraceae bacterium]MDY5887093.1 hypothetical protein [Campylobacter sp.]
MSHIIIWIIALILLVPTYGISILIAIVLSVMINKTSSSGFSGGSMEYQMNQAYLAFCKAEYGETFYSWQYNGFKLTKVIEYVLFERLLNGEPNAMAHLNEYKRLALLEKAFKIVYTYHKAKGLDSGEPIDFYFLDSII